MTGNYKNMELSIPTSTIPSVFGWISGITGQISVAIVLIGAILLALYVIPKIIGIKPEEIEYIPYDDDIDDYD